MYAEREAHHYAHALAVGRMHQAPVAADDRADHLKRGIHSEEQQGLELRVIEALLAAKERGEDWEEGRNPRERVEHHEPAQVRERGFGYASAPSTS